MRDCMISKVKFHREERYDPVSVAYMRALRRGNRTKRVYEIDPYAEVYQFRENVYAILTDNLDGGYASWSFLINGPERAMLIDTGWGLGNLKGLAEELSGGRPLLVANTHNHMDHAYGNCQFDTIYCHKFCAPYLKMQNEHMWDYVLDGKGSGKWVDFDSDDLISFKPYRIVSCENHHVFDLGDGHEVELIWLPGHAPGGAGFLDRRNRILFCGDAFISMRVGIFAPKTMSAQGGPHWDQGGGELIERPFSQYGTVKAARDEAVKLAARISEFDTIFPGHFVLDIDSYVVENTARALDEIVKNPEQFDYEETRFNGSVIRIKRIRDFGTIAYREGTVE